MRDVFDGKSGQSRRRETVDEASEAALSCPECAELYYRARSGSAPAWAELKAQVVAAFSCMLRRQVGTWIQSRRQARIAECAFYITQRRSRQQPTWEGALWDAKGVLARLVVAALRSCGPCRRTRPERVSGNSFIGESASAARVREEIEFAARTELSVLLVGETGTGKDLVAQLIHSKSPRCRRELISYNCAGMSTELVASDLFGHVLGAFTGATGDRMGIIEEAHESHLFLDELEAMPLDHQAKLLRVIEDGMVRRLGAQVKDARVVSVLYIVATNCSPEQLMAAEKLRRDFFYRIKGRRIELPPLRARAEDIPALARHFLGAEARALTPDALRALEAYDWPGNVRELMIVLANARETAAFRGEKWIRAEDILRMCERYEQQAATGAEASAREDKPTQTLAHAVPSANELRARLQPEARGSLAELRDVAEREGICLALRAADGNVCDAARKLGMHRTTLWRKLREYGLRPERKLRSSRD
jgi:transcriptional regulator with PAS, ATPase and Fis domain